MRSDTCMNAPDSTKQHLRLITVPELSELWQVKASWIYDEVESGRLKAVRLRRQLRFREDDLMDYLLSPEETSE